MAKAWVDPTGSHRRLLALGVERWSHDHLADALGLYNGGKVRQILTQRSRITYGTAQAVARVYVRLEGTQGPAHWRTTRTALEHGGRPPAAWEGVDMDDPTAVPHEIDLTPWSTFQYGKASYQRQDRAQARHRAFLDRLTEHQEAS